MNDIEFLVALQKSIWKTIEMSGSVSDAVLNTVFDIVEEHRLGVLLHNACMGFGIGITIHESISKNSHPILKITNRHLGDGNRKFEDGWVIFGSWARRNPDLLLEPLKDKYYYDY